MPATATFGPESCRGRTTGGRSCLAIKYPRPTTGTPGYGYPSGWSPHWPRDKWGLGVRRVYSAPGYSPHWWEVNQAAVQDKADALGVEVKALLCGGCNNRRLRLIEEGAWTA